MVEEEGGLQSERGVKEGLAAEGVEVVEVQELGQTQAEEEEREGC